MAAARVLNSAMRTIVVRGGESAQVFIAGQARWDSRVKLGLIPACGRGAKCTVCLLLHETQTSAHEVAQGLSPRSFIVFGDAHRGPATRATSSPGLGCNRNPPAAIPGARRPAGAVVRRTDATTSGPG